MFRFAWVFLAYGRHGNAYSGQAQATDTHP